MTMQHITSARTWAAKTGATLLAGLVLACSMPTLALAQAASEPAAAAPAVEPAPAAAPAPMAPVVSEEAVENPYGLKALWGQGDVYLHTTLIKKWDTCAPDAILRATGGRMTTLSGELIKYDATEADKKEKIEDGLLAAARFHSQLLEKVKVAKQTTKS